MPANLAWGLGAEPKRPVRGIGVMALCRRGDWWIHPRKPGSQLRWWGL